MPTAAILERLASFGIAISEDKFREAAAGHSSAVVLSEEWWERFPCTAAGRDGDFRWCAAIVLWERLAPDQPNLDDRVSSALRLADLHDQRRDQAVADRYRHLARLERKRRSSPTAMQQRARGRVGRDLAAAGITPGRNDPCRCGGGKKYKRCHLAADERRATEHQPPEAGG